MRSGPYPISAYVEPACHIIDSEERIGEFFRSDSLWWFAALWVVLTFRLREVNPAVRDEMR